METFEDLSLEITEHRPSPLHLHELLHDHLHECSLEAFCDDCEENNEMTEDIILCSAPHVLTIHLKRFNYDASADIPGI